jgi:predicted nucleic acid-binding Zn ribbon protein
MKSQPMSIGEALTTFLKSYGLDHKIDEHRLLHAWGKALGQTVEKHTTELFLKERTLFVRLSSAALKQNLLLMKSQIIERLNAEAQTQRLQEIVFL